MTSFPAHEITADKVIKNRLKQSHRFYRTMAGLGIVSGIAAGIAGNTHHDGLAATVLASSMAGTTVAGTKERKRARTVCDDNIAEIAYLNKKDVEDAIREPGSTEDDYYAQLANRKMNQLYFAPLSSFVLFNTFTDGALLESNTISEYGAIAIGSFMAGAFFADARLDYLKSKVDGLAYQKQLLNLSLLHDFPNLEQ